MPPPERIAAFDNDGTLWCEKPMPIQADFLLRRLSEMAQADSGLRDGQPWKAAYERDYGWFGTVINEHYAGNDTDVGLADTSARRWIPVHLVPGPVPPSRWGEDANHPQGSHRTGPGRHLAAAILSWARIAARPGHA